MLLDARGLRCPWPAIRLAKALRAPGWDRIEVLADDPAAPREMRAVAAAAGADFIELGEARFSIVRNGQGG